MSSSQYYHPKIAEDLEAFTQHYIKSANKNANSRGKMIIPVVVHIVAQTMRDNIPDEQIQSQITALNRDYKRQNTNLGIVHPDFQDLIADVGFEFCLASIDPNGNPTTGITRRSTNPNNVFTGQNDWIYFTEKGGQDAWDPAHYLNIWVTQFALGIAGFGSNPGLNPPEKDGVVVSPRFVGMTGIATPPFHLGRTVVHEVGHYFNLEHPFTNGCEGDDLVADVPQQLNPYDDCPSNDNISCGSRDITSNFMNYTDDDCQAMFTKGQAMRMQAALIGARYGLLNSNGCTTAVLSVNKDEIKIYPNPSSYYFCIEVGDSVLEQIPFTIYDARGAKVEEGIAFPNSLQHFPNYRNGVYFIEFKNGLTEPIIKKVVVHN